MAIYFLDSSALFKYYVIEKGTKWVNRILDPAMANLLFVSQILEVELASALSRRVREGTISQANYGALLKMYRYQQLTLLRVIPLDGEITRKAGQLALSRALRANDAAQLATALKTSEQLLDLGAPALIFLSSDIRLLAAAQAEGLQIDNPENYP